MVGGETPGHADVRQDVVILARELDRRASRGVVRRGLNRAIGVEGVGLIAVVLQVAREARRAQTDIQGHGVVEQVADVLDRELAQFRRRATVALLEGRAVQRQDRISAAVLVTAEGVHRVAVLTQQTVLARLTVVRGVEGVRQTQTVVVGQRIDQRRVDAVAVGVGVGRRIELDRIHDVAVAVQINALGGRVQRVELRTLKTLIGLLDVARAAAIGQGILIGRVDRQGQFVRQREARLAAQAEGVRRVLEVVVVAAATDIARGARLRLIVRHAGRRRIEQAGRSVARADHTLVEVLDLLVAVGVVTVAHIAGGQRQEVAVTQRLIDAAVVGVLLQVARVVAVLVIGRRRGREPGRRVQRAELARIHQCEDALIVFTADRRLDDGAEFLGRTAGRHVDRAAGGRRGRAVDVGRALVDAGAFDQLRLKLLVRIDLIVARIVHLDAVQVHRDALGVKATDRDVAARVAEGVGVGEVHARLQVQRLQDRLTGRLGRQVFLGDGRTRLADLFSDDGAVDVPRTANAGHDDVADLRGALFNGLRRGRLGRSGAGHENAAHEGGRRPEQLFAGGHLSVSPVMKA
ncbi:hypothetical protein D3C80_700030 [compost metagenome]